MADFRTHHEGELAVFGHRYFNKSMQSGKNSRALSRSWESEGWYLNIRFRFWPSLIISTLSQTLFRSASATLHHSQTHESMVRMKSIRLEYILPAIMIAAVFISEVHAHKGFTNAQASVSGSTVTQRDGSHDFDFLIGDWKAHVRRLPQRLKGSNVWVEYNGISNHKKLLDSNANFEEFDVSTPDSKLRIKAQTLRLYNPESHQWSIYLVDLDKGTLEIPPVVGQFEGKRGEFFNQQIWEGRAVLVRYMWLDISPKSSRMEQSFSGDGGKTWEVNWICELSR
jgi:hypothetical protein